MSTEVICIFVDGGNLFHSSREVGIRIDFMKLKELLTNGRRLLRPYYYGADAGIESQSRFYDSLRYIGWDVKTLPLRQYSSGIPFEKGVDVMLVTDMLVGAFRKVYDTAILCSGDKDYVYTVKAIKDMGQRVEVASFENSISKELRLSADRFISLTEHIEKIRREIVQ